MDRDLFRDRDVDALASGGGRLALGGFRELVLPRVFGFCGGVVRALNLLERTLEEAGDGRLWLLGEIIHNETVNDHFRGRGVRIVSERSVEAVFESADAGDVFVIPAFGLPEATEARLRDFVGDRGTVVDTTCPYVKRIWDFVSRAAASGKTILIHGKPEHPETRATVSRALGGRNAVVIVPTMEDALRAARAIRTGRWTGFPEAWVRKPEWGCSRFAMVHQTTMLHDETLRMADLLRQAAEEAGGRLEVADTVCRATQDRQDAAGRVCARGCDLILVLGGFASSNTNQLYRMAKSHAPAFFIQSAGALDRSRIRHFVPASGGVRVTEGWFPREGAVIGLLAGASCPAPDIGEVVRTLRELSAGE